MRQFYDSTIKVRTFKTTSGNKKALVATATAEASIQPLGKGKEQFDSGSFGKTWVAYIDIGVPVKQGDRVVDQDGNSFDVAQVVERQYGAFPYQELILKRTS